MEYDADMNKDLIEKLMDNCLPMARYSMIEGSRVEVEVPNEKK